MAGSCECFRVPQNAGNFLTIWEPVGFPRRILLHGARTWWWPLFRLTYVALRDINYKGWVMNDDLCIVVSHKWRHGRNSHRLLMLCLSNSNPAKCEKRTFRISTRCVLPHPQSYQLLTWQHSNSRYQSQSVGTSTARATRGWWLQELTRHTATVTPSGTATADRNCGLVDASPKKRWYWRKFGWKYFIEIKGVEEMKNGRKKERYIDGKVT